MTAWAHLVSIERGGLAMCFFSPFLWLARYLPMPKLVTRIPTICLHLAAFNAQECQLLFYRSMWEMNPTV